MYLLRNQILIRWFQSFNTLELDKYHVRKEDNALQITISVASHHITSHHKSISVRQLLGCCHTSVSKTSLPSFCKILACHQFIVTLISIIFRKTVANFQQQRKTVAKLNSDRVKSLKKFAHLPWQPKYESNHT